MGISQDYKKKSYYTDNNLSILKSKHRESYEKFSNNNLLNDKEFFNKLKSLYDPLVSPGLMKDEDIKKLPKTYNLICEMDALKDENLIFAQRLVNNRVKTEVAFYESCFHGMSHIVDNTYEQPLKALDDLVQYLRVNL